MYEPSVFIMTMHFLFLFNVFSSFAIFSFRCKFYETEWGIHERAFCAMVALEWRSSADEPHRHMLAHEIYCRLNKRHSKASSKAWHAHVAVLVRRIECALYVASSSAAEYRDTSTLDKRIDSVDYALAVPSLPSQRIVPPAPLEPFGECDDATRAVLRRSIDELRQSGSDPAVVCAACDALHLRMTNGAIREEFNRMSGMPVVMRCLAVHAKHAGVASSACNVVGVAAFGHVANQADVSVSSVAAAMRAHSRHIDVVNSSMAALLDLTADSCDAAMRDRLMSASVPDAVIACMNNFPEAMGVHEDGCELLIRCVNPAAKRPPAFAASAARVARAMLDGSTPATVDGISVAAELVSIMPSIPEVQQHAHAILVACAAVTRAHPTEDVLVHNIFCVVCNMVNVGGRPVADIVSSVGLLATAGRMAATCPPAVETCMYVLEFGAGITEAIAISLPNLLRGVAPEAALVVEGIIASHSLCAERAARELLEAEERAKSKPSSKRVRASKPAPRQPELPPTPVADPPTPDAGQSMPDMDPPQPPADPSTLPAPAPVAPLRKVPTEETIARRAAAKRARFLRRIALSGESECSCLQRECDSCAILGSMEAYARRVCCDLEL